MPFLEFPALSGGVSSACDDDLKFEVTDFYATGLKTSEDVKTHKS